MTLYMIGLGLYDEKDISLKGLEAIKQCDEVYLEYYTCKLACSIETLERLYNKKVNKLYRKDVEQEPEFLARAKDKNIAFLVIGDPMAATTHADLYQRARELKINTVIINSSSVFSAVGITGLQLYKFGKTSSIPFPKPGFEPETPYNVIKENNKLHTLLLLDLDPENDKYMSINEAIEYMLKLEDKIKQNIFTKDTFCVGCARLGSQEPTIIAGTAEQLLKQDFGNPVHCLIIPGEMHFMEKESVENYKK